jgi:Tol biopolymer transport system component
MTAAVPRLGLLAVVLPLFGAAAQHSSGATHLRNGVIAYGHNCGNSDRSQIYTTTATGKARHRLTTSRRFSSFGPSYSPNGNRIVFVRYKQSARFLRGASQEWDLWTMNADGTRERRLTWTKTMDEFTPAWSTDGKRIAFAAQSRRKSAGKSPQAKGIWMVGVDGRGRRQLAPGYAIDPTWSPDGSEIAFAGIDAANQAGAIFVVSANGGAATELRNDPGYNDGEPAWSPDGSRILFTSDLGSDPNGDQEYDLLVMNSSGSGIAAVAGITSIDEGDPAWSPDGRRIVYIETDTSQPHPIPQLHVIRADGTGSRAIFTGSCSEGGSAGASWQPLTR